MSQKEKREDAKQFGIKATTVKSVKFTARIWGSISNMASVKSEGICNTGQHSGHPR